MTREYRLENNFKLEGDEKFKNFDETFPRCAFGLAFGLIYPNNNKKVIRRKILIGGFVITSNIMILFWFLTYSYQCIVEGDIINLTRHLSVGIVIFLFFFKSFYLNYKNQLFGKLLKKVSKDLVEANYMNEDQQKLFRTFIEKGRLAEKIWIAIPVALGILFPLYAAVVMTYNVFNDHPQPRVMVHEMEMKQIKDKQWKTPYFEIIFLANFLQCIILAPNFAGFDGSFCIAVNHLCLKLKLLIYKLKKAFDKTKTNFELKVSVKDAIKDHQEALAFYDLIQEVYGGWLLCGFLVTSLNVSMNLYQLSMRGGVDPKYLTFAICGVCHNLVPCYFCSQLLQIGRDLCDEIYGMPWEIRGCPVVTKMLMFMITRGQNPLILTGKGIVIYNMELFVSVLQTSYSFFTLIRD